MKDYSIECYDCDGTFLVSKEKAKKEQCPNCYGANTDLLDAIEE